MASRITLKFRVRGEKMAEKFVNMSEGDFVNLAKNIVEKAKENNVVLRILGALAVYIHTEDPQIRNLFCTLERLGKDKPLFTDLDTVAYSRQQPLVKKFFETTLKFKPNIYVNTFLHIREIFLSTLRDFLLSMFFTKDLSFHIMSNLEMHQVEAALK